MASRRIVTGHNGQGEAVIDREAGTGTVMATMDMTTGTRGHRFRAIFSLMLLGLR